MLVLQNRKIDRFLNSLTKDYLITTLIRLVISKLFYLINIITAICVRQLIIRTKYYLFNCRGRVKLQATLTYYFSAGFITKITDGIKLKLAVLAGQYVLIGLQKRRGQL
jgi:hypothetical protein